MSDSYSGTVFGGVENDLLYIQGKGFPAAPSFGGWRLCFSDMQVGISGGRISDNGLLELGLAEPLPREAIPGEAVTIVRS